jgi:hypothetical protein
MEKGLGSGITSPAAANCARPPNPEERDWRSPENIDAQMAAFTRLIGATFACELSHVIAFQFGAQAARNRLPGKYAVPASPKADSGDSGPAHHPWTHQGASAEKTEALRTFTRFYAEQVAHLLDELENTRDAHGAPLLDSTLVVWASELGGNERNRDAHQTGSLPVMLFGHGQGTFKTGRYLRGRSGETGGGGVEAGRDMARLLVAAVRYMGVDVRTVGATGVDGPFAPIYA